MDNQEYISIFVTKDAPLVVKNESDIMHYGTVYMENGAYIEIRTGERFIIEDLRSLGNAANVDRASLACYPTLDAMEKIRDWTGYDIIVTTAPGEDGFRGDNGGSGGGRGENGRKGTPGAVENRTSFQLSVKNLSRNIKVLSIGGQGGDGGNGGVGGNGWNGESQEEPGTPGGAGGNGGVGGDASDAVQNVFVQWESDSGQILETESRAAPGGKGGRGGAAGRNGNYYDGPEKPAGADGRDGRDGRPGTCTRLHNFAGKPAPLAGLFMAVGENGEAPADGRLDFANPVHAQAFIDHFGGDELVAEKYPSFYGAYQKTVQAARANSLSEKLPDGTTAKTFGVTAIDAEKPRAVKGGNADGASIIDVFNYTIIHDAQPQFNIMEGSIDIVEDKKLTNLETFGFTTSSKELDYRFSTNPIDYLGANGKTLQETSYRKTITNDGLLAVEKDSSDAVLIHGNNFIISEITIDMPKSGKGNNPLIYLYNRGPVSGETQDKCYTESQVGYNKDDNTVNTLLGIKGSITFNKAAGVTGLCGFASESDTGNRKLLVQGKGAAEYNYSLQEITKFFDPIATKESPSTDLTVKFSFPDDWRCRLNKNVYDSGASSVIVDLLFSLRYWIEITDPNTGAKAKTPFNITIKSMSSLPDGDEYYKVKNGSTVYVPPIMIRWGCFAADTRIRMANGAERQISELRAGDLVATHTGDKPVQNVYCGTEKSLIHIQVQTGAGMLVTKDHPVLTEQGVIRAANLNSDYKLKMADGTHAKIAELYEVDYDEARPVYNIEVEGGLVFANGFLAGEFGTQNDLSTFENSKLFGEYGAIIPAGETQEDFSEEAKAVIEEFKQLCKERFGIEYETTKG